MDQQGNFTGHYCKTLMLAMNKSSLFLLSFFLFCFNLEAKPKILATASMWADMAKIIGGDLIEVDVIVPIGSDPHLYESTPNDIRKVFAADLILINGFTFEGWLQKLISSSGTNAKTVLLTDGIQPITNPEFKNSTDPHAWMDAAYGKIYAFNISEALCKLLPQEAQKIRTNFDQYNNQLEELHEYILKRISGIPKEQRVLITSHDAFHYYGNKYGLQVEALLGTSTDADVQTGDFLRVNKIIREKKIPAIFIESTINPKLMEQIVKENNIQIGGKLYADSLGDEASPANTYINMLRHNTKVISEALSSNRVDHAQFDKKQKSFSAYIIPGLVLLGFIFIALLYYLRRAK